MQHPSFLTTEEPLDALCHHFCLSKRLYPANTRLQPTFDMFLNSPATQLPSHVLAIASQDSHPSNHVPPIMIPVDVAMYHQCFGRVDLLPQLPPGNHSPTPHLDAGAQLPTVTLPVIPITVPHSVSIPLLFLFGLNFETDLNLLAARLLPPEVVGEFPNAAAMSMVMSRLREPQFDWYLRYNQGIWKNTLALAPHNTALVGLVQNCWNVTAEARRIRLRRL
ncbi:hypothetical protein C8J57DRAFT_1271188 [Mycena rebaudengoi]|nr:hypothetical protein C8J57DRAFT_1271188 [Mycena rebaudengoi]